MNKSEHEPLSFQEARAINPELDEASYGLRVFLDAPKSEEYLALERQQNRRMAQPLGTLRSQKWTALSSLAMVGRKLSHTGPKVQSYARETLEEIVSHAQRLLDDPGALDALEQECRKLIGGRKRSKVA